jgi:transmembrane sensor
VVRVTSETCTDADRQGLEAWLAAAPRNEVAYARVSGAAEEAQRLKALRNAEGIDPDLLAEPDRLAWSAPPRASPPRSRALPTRRMAAGLGLALLAGGGAFLFTGRGSKAYATDVGQRLSVPLEDGSRLELNTDTRLKVAYSRRRRHVHLVRGEALFHVQADRGRPFVVAADHQEVLSPEAAFFTMRRADATLKVLVLEGQVRFHGHAGPDGRLVDVDLPTGATSSFGPDGAIVRPASPEERTRELAWRNGAISLSGESLAQAIAEFNRYNLKKIVLGDPVLAALELGGYFEANDPEGFAQAVAQTFALRVSDRGDAVYLSR